MKKTILIISSDFTGHGHKSITESLLEQFENKPDVKVHVIDGFSLGGNAMLRVGKLYGSITRNAKELWKLMWEISFKKPSIINEFTEIAVRESFLKLLVSVKPDLILSVHPNFNGSILNIMSEYNINIPFVTLIADLISISPLWADSRADCIICPTPESKYKCLEFGVPESKLTVIGFPVRSRFIRHIGNETVNCDYSLDKPLQCLIMSGGEGVGNMSRIAKILLNNFNCKIKIIAGRNQILKRRLERTFSENYPGKVEVYGFMQNIQDLMFSSDIAFTRGSPNVAMEAVSCNVPLVITGALPGQEEGNPGYIQKYNLGVICRNLVSLKGIVSELLENGAFKLNQIKKSQREFRNPDVAKKIAEFVLGVESKGEVSFPEMPIKLHSFSEISNKFASLAEITSTLKRIENTRTLIQKNRKRINDGLSKIHLPKKRT